MPVCRDIEANGEGSFWFFSEGFYIRKKAGEMLARISGKSLPDPDLIWRARCEQHGAPLNSETINHPKTGKTLRLKPTDATFRLFEHWHRVGALAGVEHA